MKEFPSQGTPGAGASLRARRSRCPDRLPRPGVPVPSQETPMSRCEITLYEAQQAETAARELCRVAYDALLAAKAAHPSSAADLAVCREDLTRAEARHVRVLGQLWRARTAHAVERSGPCA